MADSSIKDNAEAAKENAGEQRGKPYYEKLRGDLRDLIKRKRENDKAMMAIESQISRLESQYLEETHAAGNIIKGFDNYIKASGGAGAGAAGGTGTATRRKGGISDHDRIFSRSSASWNRTDSPAPLLNTTGNSGGSSGPGSNAPTPTTTGGRGASGIASARDTPVRDGGSSVKIEGKNNKKKKAPAPKEQEEDSERPSKRNKITWGRD